MGSGFDPGRGHHFGTLHLHNAYLQFPQHSEDAAGKDVIFLKVVDVARDDIFTIDGPFVMDPKGDQSILATHVVDKLEYLGVEG
jgi:hypothetical protein